MINFSNSIELTISELAKTNTIEIISDKEKEKFGYDNDETGIIVHTEYLDNSGKGQSISFHLIFSKSFPLLAPKIILPRNEFDKFGFLPHIEENGLMCTFDSETTKTNPLYPIGIAKACLQRAKAIIEDGITGKNHKDYENEFKSYWLRKYDKKDDVTFDFLSLISEDVRPEDLKLLKLDQESAYFNYILHQGEDFAMSFLKYLNLTKIKNIEIPIFYLGTIDLEFAPPMSLKNRDIYKIVEGLSIDIKLKFKRFINNNDEPKTVIATIITNNNISNLIAWTHKPLNSKIRINGFRKNWINKYRLLSTFQSNEHVHRFAPVTLSPRQKQLRTAGTISEIPPFTFLVVGVGSIGSNLLYFLNSFNDVSFKLVDADLLTIENLGRHFLGYNYLPAPKVIGMKSYLLGKNPLQNIEIKVKSIIDVHLEDNNFLNSSDYIFLTTGNSNIEEYICDLMKNGVIIKPIFLIWVEPYLSGGHCIFLHPNDKQYDSFFTKESYFKYNIISDEEYINNNPLLKIQEAGCSTTFVPYSQSSVISFIASIFSDIKSIIINGENQSKAITWVGDLGYIKNHNITINTLYEEAIYNQKTIHNVNHNI